MSEIEHKKHKNNINFIYSFIFPFFVMLKV